MVAEKRISKQGAHDVGRDDDDDEDGDDSDDQIRVKRSCLPQVGIWDTCPILCLEHVFFHFDF